MKKNQKVMLIVASLAVIATGAFLLSERTKISGCDTTEWERADTFDQIEWMRGGRREKYFFPLQQKLIGMSESEVIGTIGRPGFIFPENGNQSFSYVLGDLKFFSCRMNIKAMMLVVFDADLRVERVATYAD
jgi:hypothetical protein